MPLQPLASEEAKPSLPSSMRAETPSPANAALFPRYDAATVQQILVSAQEMQAHHRETMTPDDIHSLGLEIGVEPEFVARALAQAAQGKTTAAVSTGTRGAVRRHRLTDWLPLILYALSAPFAIKGFQSLAPPSSHDTHHRQSTASSNHFTLLSVLYLIFLFVLPGLLAFFVGLRQKSKRRGAGAGAWYGLASLLAVVGATLYSAATEVHRPGWSGTTVSETAYWVGAVFFLLLGTWLGYGALLGAGGASVRQAIRRRRKRRIQAVTKIRGQKAGEWV